VSKFAGLALLSQEGSTIETTVEIVLGVVPEPHSLRMHSDTFLLGTTPRVIAKNTMTLPS
jgi:hypothetical protein